MDVKTESWAGLCLKDDDVQSEGIWADWDTEKHQHRDVGKEFPEAPSGLRVVGFFAFPIYLLVHAAIVYSSLCMPSNININVSFYVLTFSFSLFFDFLS